MDRPDDYDLHLEEQGKAEEEARYLEKMEHEESSRLNKIDIKAKQKEIINHYGFDNQLDQLIEECGELIVSIAKNKRYTFADVSFVNISKDRYDNLIEELADVKNLIEQLELEYDYVKEGIEVMIDHKVNRELDRIGRTSIGG